MGVTKEIVTPGDGKTFPKTGDNLTMHYQYVPCRVSCSAVPCRATNHLLCGAGGVFHNHTHYHCHCTSRFVSPLLCACTHPHHAFSPSSVGLSLFVSLSHSRTLRIHGVCRLQQQQQLYHNYYHHQCCYCCCRCPIVCCTATTTTVLTTDNHQSGTLASNGQKFDASRDRGRPFQFQIGIGKVIRVSSAT